ncbi:helix-turn-helix domain-containing protein [Fimbriiglobus ruber]|uniref:helix-turn-helix domain-containing protein n=1 Tax=Fimbriiglobus ruber TaxID=1908690 RepID=UPI000B4A96FB|nr:XRE family transcriptional regulator [Fimbriiglobus ruber]
MEVNFTESLSPDLPARLREARLAAGFSTREAAERLPEEQRVSHASIANYERGRSSPSLSTLAALADLYQKPTVWFLSFGPRLSGVCYRCRKSLLKKGDKAWYEANATLLLEAYVRLESELKSPLTAKAEITTLQGESPADLAHSIRQQLVLKDEDPIPSLVDVLERFGIRTIELATDLPIDGISARFGNEFVVVLNPNTPNDRCRMNAGHELIHIADGHCSDGVLPDTKETESRAYDGASHLILPDSQLRLAFRGQSMVRLVQFKERFGISLAAMIYRANKAGIVNDSTSKWLWMEFAKRGWRKQEPGYVRPDRATRFEQLVDEAITGGRLSWADAARLTNIREEDLRERRRFALGQAESVEDDDTDDDGGEPNENVLKFPR